MASSVLVLEPYQFSEEQKRIIKDLRNKMIHSGNLIVTVPRVRHGGWAFT